MKLRIEKQVRNPMKQKFDFWKDKTFTKIGETWERGKERKKEKDWLKLILNLLISRSKVGILLMTTQKLSYYMRILLIIVCQQTR
jgi:hypothetical protein